MPPPNKPGPLKRRIRKRKRRQASSSSSSSSSDSESDSQTAQKVTASSAAVPTAPADEHSSSSHSNSTSSASDTESVHDGGDSRMKSPARPHSRSPSSSPSPPDPTIPPLVTLNPTTDEEKQRDAQLREKFRKFWMASVADAFKDDLEKIQKEPNLSQSRLGLLIDSLAAGADLYVNDGKSVEEVRMVLGE